ncbi:MAG: ABC-F family ATP-binding cassette domain-containing protein [Pseudanabaenaceae cyanobacterium]|jgi:ATP-binding cassette subfamily F protein uup
MTLFTLRGISKDFGIKQILKAASFSLEEGDKVGLIGTNGSGKSTLLKIIAGLEPFDSGDLWVNSSAKVMYLPQQPNLDDERTVLEQVFADCGEQMNLIREYELISHQLAHGSTDHDHDTLLAKLSHISQRIEALGAWDVETDAKVILTKLGIQDFDAKVGTLSGGYRKRIALATALLSAPDVLLMDEPTNHLDAISVEWLQTYLKRYQGALLLITHDRYFLDQVTNRILELDQGDLFSYSGNYAYYLGKKAEAEESNASTQRKHAGVLRRELEWLKRGPKARSTKQKARIERVLAMKDQEFKQSQGKVEITTAGRRIGKKVVDLSGVFKGFEGRTLIRDFSYNFSPEDRIGIIGRNGAGKSTLMNMITGRLPADQGTVDIGTTVHFGYFDQHSDDLAEHGNQRVIDYLKSVAELVKTADGTIITASQMLERFLFNPNQQYAPIHKLSGGEKRRLFLLKVLMDAPNVLILDEPTNDLDVQTLGVLEEYLEEFNGCVIVVSHDRYFLDRTVEVVFAIESDGTIRQYPGNYSVYLECKKKEEESAAAAIATKEPPKSTAPVPATKQPPTTKPKKLSFKEKREYETLEAEIPQWETERAKLEKILYEKPPTGYSEVQKLTEQLGELVAKIDAATERWLDLAERYEA